MYVQIFVKMSFTFDNNRFLIITLPFCFGVSFLKWENGHTEVLIMFGVPVGLILYSICIFNYE